MEKKQEKKKDTSIAILSTVALSQQQRAQLSAPTPSQFVKSKPGRGGKALSYVEGGYVVSRLNEVFGPLNWSWQEISRDRTDRKTEKNTEGEVTVHGRLTIHDHRNGYAVWKEADGQHPIHVNVPVGDAYKAANTDALKKAASLFGIALDVYWQQMESQDAASPKPAKVATKQAKPQPTLFAQTAQAIKNTGSKDTLRQLKDRIMNAADKFSQAETAKLVQLINAKLGPEA